MLLLLLLTPCCLHCQFRWHPVVYQSVPTEMSDCILVRLRILRSLVYLIFMSNNKTWRFQQNQLKLFNCFLPWRFLGRCLFHLSAQSSIKAVEISTPVCQHFSFQFHDLPTKNASSLMKIYYKMIYVSFCPQSNLQLRMGLLQKNIAQFSKSVFWHDQMQMIPLDKQFQMSSHFLLNSNQSPQMNKLILFNTLSLHRKLFTHVTDKS